MKIYNLNHEILDHIVFFCDPREKYLILRHTTIKQQNRFYNKVSANLSITFKEIQNYFTNYQIVIRLQNSIYIISRVRGYLSVTHVVYRYYIIILLDYHETNNFRENSYAQMQGRLIKVKGPLLSNNIYMKNKN